MATKQLSEVIEHLRSALLLRDGAGLTDGQLLADHNSRRDEAALAILVRRHGPMVWGVCRRVLRNYHDAEDAFQATFLVLVRKAASIASPELLANWLYGVAHQTALKARATTAKRGVRERQVTEMPQTAVTELDLWNDLQPLLDEELSRLPEKYRVAIVLCELEGKTRKEAARQLGVPDGTLAARLARGRVMLAKRLARHGLAVSGGSLAAVLAQNAASASAPTSVVSSTIKAATTAAAGGAATAAISAKVAALTEGVMKAMFLSKLKSVTATLMAAAILCGAVGFLTFNVLGQDQGTAKQKNVQAPESKSNTDQGKEASQPARIVFWRGGRLAGIRPDDKDAAWLSKEPSREHALYSNLVRVSPDGKQAAYGIQEVPQGNPGTTPVEAGCKVFIRKLDAIDDAGVDLGVNAHTWCWSPDGHKLVVASFGGSDKGPPNVSHTIIDVKTKEKTELRLPAGHLVTDWSRDGKWFLTTYVSKELDPKTKGPKELPRIKLVKSDGSETRSVLGPKDLAPNQAAAFGRFSPDDSKALFIVMNVKEKPQTQQVFVTDLQGGKPRQISQELNAEIWSFCWSPDGKQIAYVWRQRNAEQAGQDIESFLVITDLEGKNARTVLTEKGEGIRLGALDWR